MIQGGLNKLLLTPYTGERKIEAEVKSGFASVKQRSTLIALTLVADAIVSYGRENISLKKGDKVLFEEKMLATNKWSKHTYNSPDISEKDFIIADFPQAVAIKKMDK